MSCIYKKVDLMFAIKLFTFENTLWVIEKLILGKKYYTIRPHVNKIHIKIYNFVSQLNIWWIMSDGSMSHLAITITYPPITIQ